MNNFGDMFLELIGLGSIIMLILDFVLPRTVNFVLRLRRQMMNASDELAYFERIEK